MSFKKIRDFLSSSGADENADRIVDVTCGRMAEEEVLKIAAAVADKAVAEKEEPWADLAPKEVTLYRDGRTKRLIWSVRYLFNWVEGGYIHGPMGFITNDDETGEVVGKDYASHP
jgi:hypothetical protein